MFSLRKARACVFVASHIHYSGQCDLLTKCLMSLVSQVGGVDVFVSVSFEDSEKEKITKVMRNFGTRVQFVLSKEKRFQMEHLYYLWKTFAEKYELVMFCDDDDFYASDKRVRKFLCAYDELSSSKKYAFVGGVSEMRVEKKSSETTVDQLSFAAEYWSWGVRPKVLSVFFGTFEREGKMDLLKHKFADMYLRIFLRTFNQDNPQYRTAIILVSNEEDIMYHYNKTNPNSVCAKIKEKSANEQFEGQLLISIMCYAANGQDFETTISKFGISEKDISPTKAIFDFCCVLFTQIALS